MIKIKRVGTNLLIKVLICVVVLLASRHGVCYAQENDMKLEIIEEAMEQPMEEPIEASEIIVEAEELDLGEYEDTMEIDEKQLLSVTVLPFDATNQTVVYGSSNESVATVNGMGRITAVSVGTTYIKVTCGKIEETFLLTVTDKEPGEEDVAVTNIELAEYEKEVEVGKIINLSATVLPSDATDTTIDFSSDNTDVATISSSGEVKGIAPGTVNITMKAGSFVKTITLTVKIATTSIEMNSNYIVLKPGESFQLKGSAQPKEAKQTLTYSSADETIASISNSGLISAKAVGNTTIIISNGDMSNAATVIVNQSETVTEEQNISQEIEMANDKEYELLTLIQEQKQTEISVEDYPIITKNILKALYTSGNVLCIKGDGYSLKISGVDILNYENQLYTDIEFTKVVQGTEFTLNDGKNLPGKVTVYLKNKEYEYMYLFNQVKEKYEKINQNIDEELKLDVQGKYLLAMEPMNNFTFSFTISIIVDIIILCCIVGYIIAKKKYWFW